MTTTPTTTSISSTTTTPISTTPARTPILYLAPWAIPGGSDTGTVDWFRTIDRERYAPHLITTSRARENALVADIEPYAEAVWNLPDLLEEAQFAPFVLDYLSREAIEVLHVMNSQLGFDLIPFVRAAHPGVAIVVQQHAEEHDESLYVNYVASRYGHLVDAYSATSEDLARRIAGYGVDRARIEVIHTNVDERREDARAYDSLYRRLLDQRIGRASQLG